MRKKSRLIAFVFVSILGSGCATSGPRRTSSEQNPVSLQYRFQHTRCGQSHCLTVALTFSGDEDGKTRIRLPDSGSGQRELYRSIQDLRVVTPGAELIPAGDPSRYDIRHRAKQQIELRYSIIQDFPDSELNQGEKYYRAVVNDRYFHFQGYAALVIPVLEQDLFSVEFEWTPFKDSHALANSFYAQAPGGRTHTHHTIATRTALRGGVYLGGEVELSQQTLQGNLVWTAFVRRPQSGKKQFQALLGKVLLAERDFWNDHAFPHFLISAFTVYEKDQGYGGNGVTNGFVVYLPENALDEKERLTALLAHELFHTWNGRRITRQDPEELVYWFSEGFTNFYSRLIRFRAGLIELPRYLSEYNEVLRDYFSSPERNAPSRRVLEEFWTNYEIERLPYRQGDILAHFWNDQIRRESGTKLSLDDFMRTFLVEAIEKGTVVSPENVDRVIRPYLARGIHPDHEKYVVRGETIDLFPEKLGTCAQRVEKDITPYDLGFDFSKSKKEGKVTGVRSGGPADGAGLRDGMPLVGWDVQQGHIQVPVTFSVLVDGVRKRIKYRAEGKRLRIPQYVLNSKRYASRRQECFRN